MSDNAKNVTVTVGPGGLSLLTIVFVLLKVFGKIDWSWWWVFSPMWMPFVIIGFIFMLAIVVAVWADVR